VKIKKDWSIVSFSIIRIYFLVSTALLCVLPFVIIISGSFTDNGTILRRGYSLLPRDFTTAAYNTIFRAPQDIVQAYKMNFYYTIIGTAVGLIVTTMTAYAISRKEFKYRNNIAFLIYFTSIFGGGMVPWYLMYAMVMNLKGSTFAIWFPAITAPFFIIIMRTFIQGAVPDSITESAKIDGAGHFVIFTRIVLPVMTPGLATVGLFLALNYWNDWYLALMFIQKKSLYPMQYLLYIITANVQSLSSMGNAGIGFPIKLPTETVKMAIACITIGPIFLVYPFIQRFFVKGIIVGAVKG